MRVALINSGLGLLGTAAALRRLQPSVDLVLSMDPDGMPWGPRQPDDIARRSLGCAQAAIAYRPDVLVFACNTGSVHALDVLRKEFEPRLPVVGTVGGGLSAGALTYLLGLAAVLILLAGLQGRSWAIWADLAVQLIPIAGFAVYPGVGFIGLIFAAVWALILYVRSEVLRRERLGLLPGQDGAPD